MGLRGGSSAEEPIQLGSWTPRLSATHSADASRAHTAARDTTRRHSALGVRARCSPRLPTAGVDHTALAARLASRASHWGSRSVDNSPMTAVVRQRRETARVKSPRLPRERLPTPPVSAPQSRRVRVRSFPGVRSELPACCAISHAQPLLVQTAVPRAAHNVAQRRSDEAGGSVSCIAAGGWVHEMGAPSPASWGWLVRDRTGSSGLSLDDAAESEEDLFGPAALSSHLRRPSLVRPRGSASGGSDDASGARQQDCAEDTSAPASATGTAVAVAAEDPLDEAPRSDEFGRLGGGPGGGAAQRPPHQASRLSMAVVHAPSPGSRVPRHEASFASQASLGSAQTPGAAREPSAAASELSGGSRVGSMLQRHAAGKVVLVTANFLAARSDEAAARVLHAALVAFARHPLHYNSRKVRVPPRPDGRFECPVCAGAEDAGRARGFVMEGNLFAHLATHVCDDPDGERDLEAFAAVRPRARAARARRPPQGAGVADRERCCAGGVERECSQGAAAGGTWAPGSSGCGVARRQVRRVRGLCQLARLTGAALAAARHGRLRPRGRCPRAKCCGRRPFPRGAGAAVVPAGSPLAARIGCARRLCASAVRVGCARRLCASAARCARRPRFSVLRGRWQALGVSDF
jgi:hypothetical protein